MAVKRTMVSRIEALEQMHRVPHKLVEDVENINRRLNAAAENDTEIVRQMHALSERVGALEPDEDNDDEPEPLYHPAEAFEQMSKRIDEVQDRNTSRIDLLNEEIKLGLQQTRDRITNLRNDHNQLAMEIREVYRRELDKIKVQLGDEPQNWNEDLITVTSELKRLGNSIAALQRDHNKPAMEFSMRIAGLRTDLDEARKFGRETAEKLQAAPWDAWLRKEFVEEWAKLDDRMDAIDHKWTAVTAGVIVWGTATLLAVIAAVTILATGVMR